MKDANTHSMATWQLYVAPRLVGSFLRCSPQSLMSTSDKHDYRFAILVGERNQNVMESGRSVANAMPLASRAVSRMSGDSLVGRAGRLVSGLCSRDDTNELTG